MLYWAWPKDEGSKGNPKRRLKQYTIEKWAVGREKRWWKPGAGKRQPKYNETRDQGGNWERSKTGMKDGYLYGRIAAAREIEKRDEITYRANRLSLSTRDS